MSRAGTRKRGPSTTNQSSANEPRSAALAVRSVPPVPASVWIALILLGLSARLVIAAISLGTNDLVQFFSFAQLVKGHGLLQAYRLHAELNHPPIPILWAVAALELAYATGGDLLAFSFIFKLPAIAADAGSCFLLYRILLDRDAATRALKAAALFAWALAPLLVSSFHGNTDTIYAMFSLLAVYLLVKGRPLSAGLALAFAINIKLVPVLLIPAMLLHKWERRAAMHFLAGLSVGVLPFVPLLIAVGPDFYRNALAYNPVPDRWGLMLPLLWNRPYPPTEQSDRLVLLYNHFGKYIVFFLALVVVPFFARRRRWSLYESAAAVFTVFLLFAPGFGVQYTVVFAPLLFAASLRWGAIYCLTAGLCVGCAYLQNWEGDFPIGAFFHGYLPHSAAALGFLAWLALVGFLVSLLRRQAHTFSAAPQTPGNSTSSQRRERP